MRFELQMSKDIAKAYTPDDFERGYEDGWDEYKPLRRVGDPQHVSEDYECGFWNGVGACAAWHEGYKAARRGVLVSPYIDSNDDDCFRQSWVLGYEAGFFRESAVMRGNA